MSHLRLAVGCCALALAACGGEEPSSGPGSERREDEQPQQQAGPPPRADQLDALCKEIVQETGVNLRIPARRPGEAYRTYSRRVARVTDGISRVYRALGDELKDLPGIQQDFQLQDLVSATGLAAQQFGDAFGDGYLARNSIEMRTALTYPMMAYGEVAPRARALNAPGCAPRPRGAP